MRKDISSKSFPSSVIPGGFGAAIAAERLRRRWSQTELATRAGLARETIVRLEAGRRPPLPDTVFRLQAVLDLMPGELVPDWPEWAPVGSATWGARSRERRRSLGLSLSDVAGALGVSVATLSRFECEVGSPSVLMEPVSSSAGDEVLVPSKALALALGFSDWSAYKIFCLGY